MGGPEEPFDKLLKAYDRFDSAAQRVETSLPFQMTAAIAELAAARTSMRETVMAYGLQLARNHGARP